MTGLESCHGSQQNTEGIHKVRTCSAWEVRQARFGDLGSISVATFLCAREKKYIKNAE